MKLKRSSGILLHPSSLPGNYGIGSLGASALGFIDLLQKAGQKLWQVLPMGHTGYGDSPYQCFSIYAGNPILIDLDLLADEGLLTKSQLKTGENFDATRVDYGKVIHFKREMLKKAHNTFLENPENNTPEYNAFLLKNAFWLDDYALFMATKEHFGGRPWWEWPDEFRRRNDETLRQFKKRMWLEIEFYRFCQYIFYKQWQNLKHYANQKGISIIGDIPLYVAHDSADVWSNHKVFQFDENLNPKAVAGVPPDYFSATGQLWGNPLYDWDVMQNDGFGWWIYRVKATLELYDVVRIDHFRGFEAYWAVPFGEKTAINGKWIKAPGNELFKTIKNELGTLPIIAEDLGIITPEVEALRDGFEFPGMKILQFAFHSNEKDQYLPHNYSSGFVVYTGTHDNDTLRGWYTSLDRNIKMKVLEYADADEQQFVSKMIKLAWSSVANMALIPMQDLLELGGEGRMNTPGTPAGNWQWRFRNDQISDEKINWLNHITNIYNR